MWAQQLKASIIAENPITVSRTHRLLITTNSSSEESTLWPLRTVHSYARIHTQTHILFTKADVDSKEQYR